MKPGSETDPAPQTAPHATPLAPIVAPRVAPQLAPQLAAVNAPSAAAVFLARLAVGVVFGWNVLCAVEFILRPALYAPGFELSGAPGRAAVQGFGVLFLMWNATYPPVMFQPRRQRTLFLVILAQQAIGLLGESWIWLQLPAQDMAARSAILRFIAFDGAGLLLLAAAYLALFPRQRKGYAGDEPESRPDS